MPMTNKKREQRKEIHLTPIRTGRGKRNTPYQSYPSRLRYDNDDDDDESDKHRIAPPSLGTQIDQLRSRHTGSKLPRRTPIPPPPPKSPSDSSRSTTPRALPRSPPIPLQSTASKSPIKSVQSKIPRSLPQSPSMPSRRVSTSRPQSLPGSTPMLSSLPLPRPPLSSVPSSPRYPSQTYQLDQATSSSIPRSIQTPTPSTPRSSHSTIRYAQSIASNDETTIRGLEVAMALVRDRLVAAVNRAPAWMGMGNHPEGLGAVQELATYLDGLETVRITVATKYEELSSCIAHTFRDYSLKKVMGHTVDDERVQKLLDMRDTYQQTRADLDDRISSVSIQFYALLCTVNVA
ncbi:hypothetical protein F5Y08DRAFT_322702 [Xylaria arbuscula]|nr:hypothetical protein F5Y08DRAFT_322702 [Xylaria arbuscula]